MPDIKTPVTQPFPIVFHHLVLDPDLVVGLTVNIGMIDFKAGKISALLLVARNVAVSRDETYSLIETCRELRVQLERGRNGAHHQGEPTEMHSYLIEEVDDAIADLSARFTGGIQSKDSINIPAPPARGMKSEVPPGG